MEVNKKLNGWKIILFCFILIGIFFGVAIISDALTQWIADINLRFILREIILRLPLTLYLMHLFVKKVIRLDNSSIYFKKKTTGITRWLFIGLAVSVVFLVLLLLFNETSYAYKGNRIESKWMVYYIVSTVAMAINGGLIEEILFRGYIMGLLKEKWNLNIAVLIPSALFGIVHLTMLVNFQLLDFLLLIVGGTLVGVMFSLMVIKTKSVFTASVFHFVWNLFFAGRILKISNSPLEEIKSIFSVHLKGDNTFLNGGKFGIEVSGIAVLIYAVLCMILFWSIKKNILNK